MNCDNHIKVSVCLCTYKRPMRLTQCLASLLQQKFTHPFEVIVADNDCEQSGSQIVEKFKAAFQDKGIPLFYLVESVQNIALARNRSLKPARGELVAFIDDDERPLLHWLQNLYTALIETNADGVWGPVIPNIPESFPEWMRRSKLFQRPTQKNNSAVRSGSMRTGNAIIKRSLLGMRDGLFDKDLGKTGGEDSDLFTWLQQQRFKFVWAEHAPVVEQIEEKRRYIRWHLRRAYRGGWTYSRLVVKRHGRGIGILISFSRVIPSSFKAFLCAIFNLNNPKYSGLLLLSNMLTNLGKLGYFLGVRLEEYKE